MLQLRRIPGVKSMELEATYLSWIDFSGTGMCKADYIDRVQKQAQIASSHGDTFGTGGETFLRFNFATQREVLIQSNGTPSDRRSSDLQ